MAKNKSMNVIATVAALIIGLCAGFGTGYMAGSHKPVDNGVIETETVPVADTIVPEDAGTSADAEVVLSVGDASVYLDEVNARIYALRDEYVAQYGEDPWNIQTEDGQLLSDYAKQTLHDEVIRNYILCDKAGDYDITLSDDEKKDCEERAAEYVDGLGTQIAADFSITKEAVQRIYENDTLSMNVYNAMLEELTASMRAEDTYKDMSDEDFETALMAQFEEQYQEWQDSYEIKTSETWDALVIGAVG